MVYRTAPFSMTWNDPKPRFQVTTFFMMLHISETVRDTYNEILRGTCALLKNVISNDLE